MSDNLIKIQTPEEAVSDSFFAEYEANQSALSDRKKQFKLKRELKRIKDKKKKKYKHVEVVIVHEEEHKGFPIQIIECGENHYKMISPFFKKGCSSIPRKGLSASINQAYYVIHCLFNYQDMKEEMLNDKGLLFIETTTIKSESPSKTEIKNKKL